MATFLRPHSEKWLSSAVPPGVLFLSLQGDEYCLLPYTPEGRCCVLSPRVLSAPHSTGRTLGLHQCSQTVKPETSETQGQ